MKKRVMLEIDEGTIDRIDKRLEKEAGKTGLKISRNNLIQSLLFEYSIGIGIKEMPVLQYSKNQNGFHIEPLEKMIDTNMRAFERGENIPDYIPIAYGGESQMFNLANELEKKGKQNG